MLFNAFALLATIAQVGVYVGAVATKRDGGPVVSLNYATFEGASTGGVDSFLGIPYAQPPVGDLRFRRPEPPLSLSGTTLVSDLALLRVFAGIRRRCLTVNQATTFGDACSQQNFSLPSIPGLNYTALVTFVSKVNASEDCTCAFCRSSSWDG
jgi:acetylcholinesterase